MVQKEKEVDFVGHYPNTKHHLRLQLYREEQKVSVHMHDYQTSS